MKKLLILASVVAMACVTNAASFTWGFSSDSIEDSTGGYINGGTAFLYLGTVTASDTGFDYSGAKLLASAEQDANNWNYGNFDSSSPTTSSNLESTTAGQTYTLILLEQSGAASLDGYEGNYILATGSSGEDTDPMTGSKWATFVNTTAYSASAWQPMAAPEPTSGLLLLLGVAGLALKRKRA